MPSNGLRFCSSSRSVIPKAYTSTRDVCGINFSQKHLGRQVANRADVAVCNTKIANLEHVLGGEQVCCPV